MTQIMFRQFYCPAILRPCIILEVLPGFRQGV
jgi:hypothetical protein